MRYTSIMKAGVIIERGMASLVSLAYSLEMCGCNRVTKSTTTCCRYNTLSTIRRHKSTHVKQVIYIYAVSGQGFQRQLT